MSTPEQRALSARIAAETRWAHEDPSANAERGQRGLRAKFEREIREKYSDLREDQIAKRAEHLYKAHMASLALKSLTAREARKAGAK
jgi:hypothetical protein